MRKNTIAPAELRSNRRISRRAALAQGASVLAGAVVAPRLLALEQKAKVVVWSEGTANVDPASKKVYPDDINSAIAEGLKPLESQGWEVIRASLNDPDQGLSESRLNTTDVLIWWGHKRHGDVKDDLVDKIAAR